jgi:hypothetical protein
VDRADRVTNFREHFAEDHQRHSPALVIFFGAAQGTTWPSPTSSAIIGHKLGHIGRRSPDIVREGGFSCRAITARLAAMEPIS